MFYDQDPDNLIYNESKACLLHRTFPHIKKVPHEKRLRFTEMNDVEIKEGHFDETEDQIIQKNYFQFLTFYKLEDNPTTRCALFGTTLLDKDPDQIEIFGWIKQLVKPCGFYYRLAEGLENRLISSVYDRAKYLFLKKSKKMEQLTRTYNKFNIETRITAAGNPIIFGKDHLDDLSSLPSIVHEAFPFVRNPSAYERQEFTKKTRITILEGKFSEEEDAKITNNYNKFLSAFGLADDFTTRCTLFGFRLDDPNQKEKCRWIKSLVKPSRFYFRLADGLPNRLLSTVYDHCRKLFRPFRILKEIDTETKKNIVEYAIENHKKEKKVYSKISNKFDVDPVLARSKVVKTYNLHSEHYFKRGKIMPKEKVKLLDAICKHLEKSPEEITQDDIKEGKINWTEVSRILGSRDSWHCCFYASKPLTRYFNATKKQLIEYKARKLKKEEK